MVRSLADRTFQLSGRPRKARRRAVQGGGEEQRQQHRRPAAHLRKHGRWPDLPRAKLLLGTIRKEGTPTPGVVGPPPESTRSSRVDSKSEVN